MTILNKLKELLSFIICQNVNFGSIFRSLIITKNSNPHRPHLRRHAGQVQARRSRHQCRPRRHRARGRPAGRPPVRPVRRCRHRRLRAGTAHRGRDPAAGAASARRGHAAFGRQHLRGAGARCRRGGRAVCRPDRTVCRVHAVRGCRQSGRVAQVFLERADIIIYDY